MVPHWNSKESGLIVSQGAFLLLRTYLSLVVTRLDGEVVRDLVSGNGKGFLWGIVKWCSIGGRSAASIHVFSFFLGWAGLNWADYRCRFCIIYKRSN